MLCKWLKALFKPRVIYVTEVRPTVEKPSWYVVAEHEIGVKERPGGEDNPRIVEYHGATSMGRSPDSVPWCASFANWCLKQAGAPGTNKPNARSFLTWGKPLKKPELGAVTVFWRGSRSGWQGHVGFFVKTDGDYIYVLGGNQSDEVNIQAYHKSKLLGYRWVS